MKPLAPAPPVPQPIPPRPAPRRPPGPDPARLASLLARAWLEVRAGRRPLSQLEPLVAPAVQRRLAAQVSPRAWARRHATIRIRRVVATWPSPYACEATVVVDRDGRITAFAIRLERHRGAWRAVELTAPEAGLPPLATASLPSAAPIRDAFDEALEEAGEPLPPHLHQTPHREAAREDSNDDLA